MEIAGMVLAFYKETLALIAAFAWPAGVVAAAWLFRREVRGLLDRVESVNWRDGILQLRESVREAQADMDHEEAVTAAQGAASGTGEQNAPQPAPMPEPGEIPPEFDDKSVSKISTRNRYLTIAQRVTPSYYALYRLIRGLADEHLGAAMASAPLDAQIQGLVANNVLLESVGVAISDLRRQRQRLLRVTDQEDPRVVALNALADDLFHVVKRAAALARNRKAHSADEH